MIEDMVSEIFERIGHMWRTTLTFIQPSAEDVRAVLDEAAVRLYDDDVATQFQTGGLIIEKAPTGYDVYVYVGNYE